MPCCELAKDIWSVGALDWDRRLFDELIPLPDGTTYNAYLIRGSEKTALLDTVDPTRERVLFDNLESLQVRKIDYVIAHHAEQDHAGCIPAILARYPEAKLLCTPKAKEFLQDLLPLDEARFQTVADRETLSLGDRTLEFIHAAWVHWPETMMTYVPEERILFPCDLFGAHYAGSSLFCEDEAHTYKSAKRYYAEIMMPFRTMIRKHLDLLRGFDLRIIAPSHGPAYPRPALILDAYRDWTSETVKNEVLIPYVSMHGSTQRMVDVLVDCLRERKIAVKPFNMPRTDIGELAIALVDAATVVLGTPTVLAGPHPAVVITAALANALRPKTKFASLIGSYGWGGKTKETIVGMLGNLKVELLDPVMVKGYPRPADEQALAKLADAILAKHRELGIA